MNQDADEPSDERGVADGAFTNGRSIAATRLSQSLDHMATSPKSLVWLHVPLAGLGIYNTYKFIAYFIEVWRSLHQQGMGHGYLFVTAVLGSWWNLLGLALCFFGSSIIRNCGDKPLARTLALALVGAVVSLFVPGLMQGAYYIVVAWLHSVLFR